MFPREVTSTCYRFVLLLVLVLATQFSQGSLSHNLVPLVQFTAWPGTKKRKTIIIVWYVEETPRTKQQKKTEGCSYPPRVVRTVVYAESKKKTKKKQAKQTSSSSSFSSSSSSFSFSFSSHAGSAKFALSPPLVLPPADDDFFAIFIEGDLGGLPEEPTTVQPSPEAEFTATSWEKRQVSPARQPPGRERYMHTLLLPLLPPLLLPSLLSPLLWLLLELAPGLCDLTAAPEPEEEEVTSSASCNARPDLPDLPLRGCCCPCPCPCPCPGPCEEDEVEGEGEEGAGGIEKDRYPSSCS